jgi:hypothetical protein
LDMSSSNFCERGETSRVSERQSQTFADFDVLKHAKTALKHL